MARVLFKTLAVIAGLAVLLLAAGFALAHQRMQRSVDVAVSGIVIPTDAAAVERGAYLYVTRSCARCHGGDASGLLYTDEAGLRLGGPGIGTGRSSATLGYQPVDWVRTIRHGVKPNGRPVMVMPSQDFSRLHDADVGAIVAYLRSLPPVPALPAVVEMPWWLTLYYGLGGVKDAAAEIDHLLPVEPTVAVAVSVPYGRYLSSLCSNCHGATLQGGAIAGAPGDWPPAPGLGAASDSAMRRYTNADTFARMMRSGLASNGRSLAAMPADEYARLSDTDLQALHLYLTSKL